jgi:hypothetical protein
MCACPGAPQASSCDAPPENCPIALTRTLVVELELDTLGVELGVELGAEQPFAASDLSEYQGGRLHAPLGKAGRRS